jgi:hypothetical protein
MSVDRKMGTNSSKQPDIELEPLFFMPLLQGGNLWAFGALKLNICRMYLRQVHSSIS